MSQTFTDVPCTVCGCVCDDLSVSVENNAIGVIERACDLARPWFDALRAAPPAVPAIDGRPVDYAEALAAAAEILKRSRAPLVYGLSRSSTPGQRAAVALAERLGGTIDTTASICHGPSIVAIQQAGESTCSLGEVRQRADLVIFWGADPARSHPRHFERYSAEPSSEFLPGGRADRHIVVIDRPEADNASISHADEFLAVAEERDFEVITALRLLVRGEAVVDADVRGVDLGQLVALAERMKACRYGVVFFGLGLAQSHLGHATVDALLRLVAELNAHTRFAARRLRIPGDVSGADSVLCWQTGFPFAVDFSRGYPRYNPGEYSANERLERGEVDACVLVGTESLKWFSPAAREALLQIQTIVLDYPHAETPLVPSVKFVTAVYGIHAEGTVYRMDEVPLPLRRLCDAPYPTDEQVLGDLERAMAAAV